MGGKTAVKEYIKRGTSNAKRDLLLMGLTFKEDCTDTRNSKSIELGKLLIGYGFNVYTSDPYITKPRKRCQFPGSQ